MKKTLAILILLFPALLLSKAITFRTKRILINSNSINVQVAETSDQHEKGLMFRTHLKNDEGMLFVFDNESVRTFWMKNTFVPLSIAFLNAKKEIIDIQDMNPAISEMQNDLPIYKSSGPARYALEMSQGWFRKKNVKIGDRASF